MAKMIQREGPKEGYWCSLKKGMMELAIMMEHCSGHSKDKMKVSGMGSMSRL